MQISGAILAGGASSRMGRNKALLAIDDRRLIERVAAALRQVADDLFLVANDASPYAFLGLPAYADAVSGAGPLGGLLTALRQARQQHCLVLACDLPFVTPELLRFLATEAAGKPALALRTADGVQPLCAAYSKACLPIVEQLLAGADYKMGMVLERAGAHIVDIAKTPFGDELLFNVNTPAELQRARRRP